MSHVQFREKSLYASIIERLNFGRGNELSKLDLEHCFAHLGRTQEVLTARLFISCFLVRFGNLSLELRKVSSTFWPHRAAKGEKLKMYSQVTGGIKLFIPLTL